MKMIGAPTEDCDGRMKRLARLSLMNSCKANCSTSDREYLAAVARRAANGPEVGVCESDSKSAATGCRVWELSSKGVYTGEKFTAPSDRYLLTRVRNLTSCITQSINRLYRVNQEYPKT